MSEPTPTLTVRDHSQPCKHGFRGPHGKMWGATECPGGRKIVFEQWGNWCWAHDREPHGPFGDACLMQGYRGDCDVRPMYELVEVSGE